MGLTTGFGTSQKQEPAGSPGPPFDPTSANNGLSVDGTGHIVLGNDVGIVQPAALLNSREIDLAGNFFQFSEPSSGQTVIRFTAGQIEVSDGSGNKSVFVTPTALFLTDVAGNIQISNNGLFVINGIAGNYLEIDVVTGNARIAQNLQVSGINGLDVAGGTGPGTGVNITTFSSGGGGFVNLHMVNNGGNEARLFFTDQDYVANPFVGAGAVGFHNETASGGVAISSLDEVSNIRFAVGGIATTDEIARFTTTGLEMFDNRVIILEFGTAQATLTADILGFDDGTNPSGMFFSGGALRIGDYAGGGNNTVITIADALELIIVDANEGTEFHSAAGAICVSVIGDTNVQLGAARCIVMSGDTVVLHTDSNWGNGAGASVGTITNAPAAGNPTKWLIFDDNGTQRRVPAW